MSAVEELFLPDPEATEQFGRHLAELLGPGDLVYLHGDLGAGKTSLVQAVLRGKNYSNPVKSPTYTLVEPHDLDGFTAYHFDLYRLSDPEELEFLGGRDYFDGASLCLVEWPERGTGWLPGPTLTVALIHKDGGRQIRLDWHEKSRNVEKLLRHSDVD